MAKLWFSIFYYSGYIKKCVSSIIFQFKFFFFYHQKIRIVLDFIVNILLIVNAIQNYKLHWVDYDLNIKSRGFVILWRYVTYLWSVLYMHMYKFICNIISNLKWFITHIPPFRFKIFNLKQFLIPFLVWILWVWWIFIWREYKLTSILRFKFY